MTRVATMGTASCATIAINDFKNGSEISSFKNVDENEEYKKDPKAYRKNFKIEGYSVSAFTNHVLYPFEQELGQSGSMPFEMLMEDLKERGIDDKFTIATLNTYQHKTQKYWRNELERWGFEVIDATKNSAGQVCYIYVRNKARVDVT